VVYNIKNKQLTIEFLETPCKKKQEQKKDLNFRTVSSMPNQHEGRLVQDITIDDVKIGGNVKQI